MLKLKLLGLAAAMLLAGPMAANAVDLNVNGSGVLVGANGVEVGGSMYNVEFVVGSCIDLFAGCDSASDFTFQDAASAQAASVALLSSVFTGVYGTEPWRTQNCATYLSCWILTPYALSAQVGGLTQVDLWEAVNFVDSDVDAPGWLYPTDDLSQYPPLVYARWTRVPEPGTLALLGLGLAGLGFTRRRRG